MSSYIFVIQQNDTTNLSDIDASVIYVTGALL